MHELEAALAAVPPAQKSVHTLRDADLVIPDLPRRITAALTDGSLVLVRQLDAPAEAPISFGWLAVVRWLATLPAERHAGVPASFFAALLDDADEPLRIAAAQALAHHPREAFAAFGPRAAATATKEAHAVAATLALGALRDARWTDEEARSALAALEALARALRAQAKKDAGDAAELARRRVLDALRSAIARDDVAAFDRFGRGATGDDRMPGEISPNFTFLAEACGAGARQLAARLLTCGADVPRALLGLAGSSSALGLALLLELAPLDEAALARGLDAAVISPHPHRAPQVQAIAARLSSIELTHPVEPNLPFLATLARFGLLQALEGKEEAEAMTKPMPAEVIAKVQARDVGIELRRGARFVDLVPASRASAEARLRQTRNHGSPSLQELEWRERLIVCEAWLRQSGRL